MWDHAYITDIQINYTCSINSTFTSSPILYELRYQKYTLNGLQCCLGYSHFSDTLLISIYWTRMKIKIGKRYFHSFSTWEEKSEWTDYCINGYIDLVLACRRQWLEWEIILIGSLHLWWIIKYNDLLFNAVGKNCGILKLWFREGIKYSPKISAHKWPMLF